MLQIAQSLCLLFDHFTIVYACKKFYCNVAITDFIMH